MNKRQRKKQFNKFLKREMDLFNVYLKDHYERDSTIQDIHATLRLLEKDPNNKMIFYDAE